MLEHEERKRKILLLKETIEKTAEVIRNWNISDVGSVGYSMAASNLIELYKELENEYAESSIYNQGFASGYVKGWEDYRNYRNQQ